METDSRMVGARGWASGDGELVCHGDRVSGGKDGRVLEMAGGDGCTTVFVKLLQSLGASRNRALQML